MKAPLYSRRHLLGLTGSALAWSCPLLAQGASNALAVVVGAASARRTLTSDELRRIFLNKDTDSGNGERFVPINQRSGSAERIRFDEQVLNMTAEQSARYWIDQRLRGRRAPATVGSLSMLRRALNDLPGAISYMLLADVDSSLRALSIDGHGPRDTGYPIR